MKNAKVNLEEMTRGWAPLEEVMGEVLVALAIHQKEVRTFGPPGPNRGIHKGDWEHWLEEWWDKSQDERDEILSAFMLYLHGKGIARRGH